MDALQFRRKVDLKERRKGVFLLTGLSIRETYVCVNSRAISTYTVAAHYPMSSCIRKRTNPELFLGHRKFPRTRRILINHKSMRIGDRSDVSRGFEVDDVFTLWMDIWNDPVHNAVVSDFTDPRKLRWTAYPKRLADPHRKETAVWTRYVSGQLRQADSRWEPAGFAAKNRRLFRENSVFAWIASAVVLKKLLKSPSGFIRGFGRRGDCLEKCPGTPKGSHAICV